MVFSLLWKVNETAIIWHKNKKLIDNTNKLSAGGENLSGKTERTKIYRLVQPKKTINTYIYDKFYRTYNHLSIYTLKMYIF